MGLLLVLAVAAPFLLARPGSAAARHRLRHRDRRDRAGPGHRLRRTGLAGPRVLPRHRRLYRRGHQRRPRRAAPSASASRRSWSGCRRRASSPRSAGIIVAPLATRLRGLYLAIVTLGLVFIGEYFFSEWSEVTRRHRASAGRRRYPPSSASVSTSVRTRYVHPGPEALLAGARAAGHLRSRGPQHRPIPGRPGVHRDPRPRHRGRRDGRQPGPVQDDRVRGVVVLCRLLRGAALRRRPASLCRTAFNLEMSVLFIAMVLVGGAGTISGAILGAFFFTCCPR